MKRKLLNSLLFAAAILLGMAGTANAQVKGTPWNERWDSCMRGTPAMMPDGLTPVNGFSPAHYLPLTPGGPYAHLKLSPVPTDDVYVATPLRIYQNCPVQIDTAFKVPAGTKRQVIFKDMPKDEQGQHYIMNRLTGRVFSEFDPVDLPDATEPTPFPMLFEHYALSPGDPVYEDGYHGAIIAEIKINGTVVRTDTIKYQYFQRPTATLNFEAPGPMVAGKFELTFHGELIQPENYVGFNPKAAVYNINTEDKARNLDNFKEYTAGAYYSLDEGATWIPAPTKTIKLTQSQIDELPDELTKKRELASLRSLRDAFPKMVIVRKGSYETDVDGIRIVRARDFFLDNWQ